MAALDQFALAANFLGFASVFAAISFAIARILRAFRTGGGQVQQAAGGRVLTLRMPGMTKVFIALMAMATILIGAVVLHVSVGSAIVGDSAYALGHAAQWGVWLEGGPADRHPPVPGGDRVRAGLDHHRRRFQAVRVRELPDELPTTPLDRLPA